MRYHETIIIGGGFAGFGCANHLLEKNYSDFLILTKAIAERTSFSPNGCANYGSLYVSDLYHHCLRFVKLRDRIRLWQFRLQHEATNKKHSLGHDFLNLPSLFRLLPMFFKVKRHYGKFKERSAFCSQKAALEQDAFLFALYNKPASVLIGEMGLEYWADRLFGHLVRFSTFCDINEISAFTLFGCLALLFVPTYRFGFDKNALINSNLLDKIEITEVVKVERSGDLWNVSSSDGSIYLSKAVILAVPFNIASQITFLNLKGNTPINICMTHVEGVPRTEYAKGMYRVFSAGKNEVLLIRALDGTFILYTRNDCNNFSQLFEKATVLKKVPFNPAFHLGFKLVESDLGGNLYIIGDANIPDIEDSYISGIYAANRILATLGNGSSVS